MSDRDCEKCKHHTEKGCDSWDCEFEQRMTKEDIHREKEQAYMQGYEDACKKYRQEPVLDKIRAEIERLADDEWNKQVGSVSQGLEDAIEIIDKYRTEENEVEDECV